MTKYLLLPLLLLSLLNACSDDEEALPPYIQGLADLQTDANGRGTVMVTDEGRTLALSNPATGLHADTTYRIVAAYLPDGTAVRLQSYSPILATRVGQYAGAYITTDPLDVTACWKGAEYVNFRLALKASATGTHYFGFHQTDYIRYPNGKRTLCALLLHDQNKDPLYYTRETYLSLPLAPLKNLLTPGRDSIRVTAHTFDGTFVKTFAL